MRLRLKARARSFCRDLKRPLRLVLFLLMAFGITTVALLPEHIAGQPRGLPKLGLNELGVCLLLLPLLSAWTAVRQGVIVFRPEEVHFLFPAPVSSRALLLTHMLGVLAKSLSGALMFAVFVRPAGTGFLTTALGYGLYLQFMMLMPVSVDLTCLRWPGETRRRRARWLLAAMVALFVGAVGLAWVQDGRALLGTASLRHAILPMLPFTTVICGGELPGSLPYGVGMALVLAILAALAARILSFRGDVREAAHKASLVQAKALESVRNGRVFVDGPREHVGGSLLPMLPQLGGAGVHCWRQLTVLLRTRKSYALLLMMTVATGVSVHFTHKAGPAVVGLAMLGVLVVSGPMFVRCDFRSDYDCLPWLRTLPTPPGVLAAGQLLASALALYVIQLVFSGWSLFVCPPEYRLALLGVYVALPVFNLLQLSVWNGAHLMAPLRPGGEHGTPDAATVLRLYMVMLAIMLVIGAALAVTGLFAAAAWFGLPSLGVDGTQARSVVSFLVGLMALGTVTAVCVWCVGRLFLRVDCSRDLSG